MDEPVLRVLQLNVGSLFEPGWDERRHEIVAWVERLRPDVVCFQEIWESDSATNTAAWIVEQLAERGEVWHWAFEGAPFHPDLWADQSMRFGSALSRWPIESSRYDRLPVVHDAEPFVNQVPWELFSVRTAGLDVFSTHLAAAPHQGRDRVEQVLAVDRIINEVRGGADRVVPGQRRRPAMPAVLCGDFNAEPDSDEIRFLSSLTAIGDRTTFYQDAWRVAGDGGPGHTQDWRTHPLAAGLNIHRKRVDYIFVGDPFLRVGNAGRVVRAEVVADESLTGTQASDHCGLLVEIVWPDRPGAG